MYQLVFGRGQPWESTVGPTLESDRRIGVSSPADGRYPELLM